MLLPEVQKSPASHVCTATASVAVGPVVDSQLRSAATPHPYLAPTPHQSSRTVSLTHLPHDKLAIPSVRSLNSICLCLKLHCVHMVACRTPVRVTTAHSTMLAALCMAALLAASGVREAAAAAPAACSLPANANCQLTQCPCYHKQIDNANYTRPAGCVAEVCSRNCCVCLDSWHVDTRWTTRAERCLLSTQQ